MKNNFKVHETVFLPVSRCVRCRKLLDAATGLQDREPKEGDVSICAYCGQVMLFDKTKKLRAAQEAEFSEIKTELAEKQPEVLKLIEKASGFFAARRAQREN